MRRRDFIRKLRSTTWLSMSALGQKQTYAVHQPNRESGFPHKVMSALPPKADMCGATRNVRFGPKSGSKALLQ